MNKNDTTEQINAFMGESHSTEEVDWKKKCEELEKQLNSSRVEEGRVRKLSEELKARDKELAEFRAAKEDEGLLENLSAEEREEIPPEILNAATKLVRQGMHKIRADYDQKMREYEERLNSNHNANLEETRQRMLSRVDNDFPNFRADVSTGGDKQEAWAAYRRYNQASIAEAVNSGDYDTFAYHIRKFYTDHLGVSIPNRWSEDGAHDPVSTNSSNHGFIVDGKRLTAEDLDALYEDVERARERNDFAEMKRISEIIKKATMGG